MNGRRDVGDFLIEQFFRHGKRMRWDNLVQSATGEPLTSKYFVSQFVAGR
jgi:Zn-dependent M32 family carboxypeptidase